MLFLGGSSVLGGSSREPLNQVVINVSHDELCHERLLRPLAVDISDSDSRPRETRSPRRARIGGLN